MEIRPIIQKRMYNIQNEHSELTEKLKEANEIVFKLQERKHYLESAYNELNLLLEDINNATEELTEQIETKHKVTNDIKTTKKG